MMTELNDKEWTERAFHNVRRDFEVRRNKTGLDMLDGLEEQWIETGSLSDGQKAWLARQLDGSWNGKGIDLAKKPKSIFAAPEPQRPSHSDMSAANEDDLFVDELITHRLAERGKVAVDIDHLDTLGDAIDELGENIKIMRQKR